MMVKITIPFAPEMEVAVIEGRKCCTTRLERKGNPGDEFPVGWEMQRIIDVLEFPLWQIAKEMYRLEGFNSPEEFIDLWNTLPGYPEYKYAKYSEFPVHFFLPTGVERAD